MPSASTFLLSALWIMLGIIVVLWAMLCGAIANWGEKRGAEFQKTMLISFFFTPLAGFIFVKAGRSARTSRSWAPSAVTTIREQSAGSIAARPHELTIH